MAGGGRRAWRPELQNVFILNLIPIIILMMVPNLIPRPSWARLGVPPTLVYIYMGQQASGGFVSPLR